MKPIACPTCGSVFTPRQVKHRFCSRSCAARSPNHFVNVTGHPIHGHAPADEEALTTPAQMKARDHHQEAA
jgi:hypothetical protein